MTGHYSNEEESIVYEWLNQNIEEDISDLVQDISDTRALLICMSNQ